MRIIRKLFDIERELKIEAFKELDLAIISYLGAETKMV